MPALPLHHVGLPNRDLSCSGRKANLPRPHRHLLTGSPRALRALAMTTFPPMALAMTTPYARASILRIGPMSPTMMRQNTSENAVTAPNNWVSVNDS